MARFVDQFFTQITGPAAESGLAVGEAPRLVFLHGVMGYAMNWRRVAKAFEDRYQVLAYDSRGHGRSVHADLLASPDAYSPESLAEDLRKILDDLGWEKVFLVGHSMGGRVAYTFAARYPDRVHALVIEDIGPEASPVGRSTPVKILDTVPVPFIDKRAAKDWFETEFPKVFPGLRTATALAAWLYANITENEAGEGVWRFHASGIRAAIEAGHSATRWADIEALAVPTLIVRGELSTDLSRSDFEKMIEVTGTRAGALAAGGVLRTRPPVEGIQIEGVGHWIHSEKHDEFVAALKKFLSQHAVTGTPTAGKGSNVTGGTPAGRR